MNRNVDNATTRAPFPGREDGLERRLDDALDDTFPASDPVQLAGGHSKRDAAARGRPAAGAPGGEQGRLDEGLEETFPASDPVSISARKVGGP